MVRSAFRVGMTLLGLLLVQGGAACWAQQQNPAPAATPKSGSTGAAAPAGAPTAKLTIDLAAGAAQTWAVEPGTYAIQLTNAVPGESYSVIVGATALGTLPPL